MQETRKYKRLRIKIENNKSNKIQLCIFMLFKYKNIPKKVWSTAISYGKIIQVELSEHEYV